MIKPTIFLTSAWLVALSFSAAQAANQQTISTSEIHAMTTLKGIEESAARAAEEADLLQQAGNEITADSQYEHLVALRDEINAIGRGVSSLDAESQSLAPWQKQAVDKVQPLLRETAGDTEKAIQFFNANRNELWHKDYRNDVSGAFHGSEQIEKTLKDYLKFAQTRDEEQRLRQGLEGGGQ